MSNDLDSKLVTLYIEGKDIFKKIKIKSTIWFAERKVLKILPPC